MLSGKCIHQYFLLYHNFCVRVGGILSPTTEPIREKFSNFFGPRTLLAQHSTVFKKKKRVDNWQLHPVQRQIKKVRDEEFGESSSGKYYGVKRQKMTDGFVRAKQLILAAMRQTLTKGGYKVIFASLFTFINMISVWIVFRAKGAFFYPEFRSSKLLVKDSSADMSRHLMGCFFVFFLSHHNIFRISFSGIPRASFL